MITRGYDHAMQPCWANDGRHIFFTSRSTGGATQIKVIDTEFEEAKPIPCTIKILVIVPSLPSFTPVDRKC